MEVKMGVKMEVKMGVKMEVKMEVKKDNSNVGGSSAAKHSSALTPHLTPSYNFPFNS